RIARTLTGKKLVSDTNFVCLKRRRRRFHRNWCLTPIFYTDFLGSADGDRIAGSARCAGQLHRREDERELVNTVRRELRQIEVLEVVDAAAQQPLMPFDRARGILAGDRLHREIVRAGQQDSLLREPLDRRDAGAGLACAVRIVVDVPELSPAGMKKDRVAGTDLVDALHLERAFDVLDRDDVRRIETLDAFVARNVEEHAAREQRADVLDAELREAIRRAELRQLEAVVEHIVAVDLGADVAEPVELRADLAELAADELVVEDDGILGARDHGREPGDRQAEMPVAEERHAEL